jgi:hypothetical protein
MSAAFARETLPQQSGQGLVVESLKAACRTFPEAAIFREKDAKKYANTDLDPRAAYAWLWWIGRVWLGRVRQYAARHGMATQGYQGKGLRFQARPFSFALIQPHDVSTLRSPERRTKRHSALPNRSYLKNRDEQLMVSIRRKYKAVVETFGIPVDPEDVGYIDYMFSRRGLTTVPERGGGRELAYIVEWDETEHLIWTMLDRIRDRDGREISREVAGSLIEGIGLAMKDSRHRAQTP